MPTPSAPAWFAVPDQSRSYATQDTVFGLIAFFRPGAIRTPPGPDTQPLLTQILAEVRPGARYQRFASARGELADAEGAVARLHLDMEEARTRAGRARLDLGGAERAVALGQTERDHAAAEVSAAAITAGLPHMRGDLRDARAAAESDVRQVAEAMMRQHGLRPRPREEILADLARIASPLLEELSGLPHDGGAAVAQEFGAMAVRRLLADATPERVAPTT
jgi:hypothetical protein